jgi:hypothetical protein
LAHWPVGRAFGRRIGQAPWLVFVLVLKERILPRGYLLRGLRGLSEFSDCSSGELVAKGHAT